MKILFYFGHPAQYLFLRATIRNLIRDKKNEVVILIKTKDVLEDLIKTDGFAYKNVLPKERGISKNAVFISFIKRLFILLPVLIREKPKILIGSDATLALLGRLLKINRITTLEDDYNVIKNLAKIAYPNTQSILCPEVCNVGKHHQKKIGYSGYMKLGYLHPNYFSAKKDVLSKYNISSNFVLVRLARLTAHHDFGVSGMSEPLLDEIIEISKQNQYSVFISSETTINKKYETFLLKNAPIDLHHILALASLLISDSQSMSVEAAMLGTPSLRFSSLAGKISVLEELEHRYKLTFGINPATPDVLLQKTTGFLKQKNLKEAFLQRRKKMLNDKIDVTAFLTWFIENYPESKKIMKENPDYQYRFK